MPWLKEYSGMLCLAGAPLFFFILTYPFQDERDTAPNRDVFLS
jgi:hypothetical protein